MDSNKNPFGMREDGYWIFDLSFLKGIKLPKITNEEIINAGMDNKTKEEIAITYCGYGCKYEDANGFCTKDQNKKLPSDALCKYYLVGFKPPPEGLVPVNRYKELKAKDEYGFK